MKKQIFNLVNTLPKTGDSLQVIELFSACCAWLKLTETGKLDNEQAFSEFATLDQLHDMLNSCVTVEFNHFNKISSNEQLTELMRSLRQLIQAKVISYQDLSDGIKEWLGDAGGKKFGNMTLPVELAQLGVALLRSKVETVYIPFQTGFHFAHTLPNNTKIAGETGSREDAFFADIHDVLLDGNFCVVKTDPIQVPSFMGDGGLRQFQSSIAFPPLALKYGKEVVNDLWDRFPEKSLMGDVYHLRHMLAQSTDCVVCFVANGFLFRTTAGEKQFKHDIVTKNWLKLVIELPANLLQGTGVSVSIIVLDKKKVDDSITFIDASDERFSEKSNRLKNKLLHADEIIAMAESSGDSPYSKVCTIDDVVANDFNLSPGRYVLSGEQKKLNEFLSHYEKATLSDLVEIVRPQAVKQDENPEETFVEYNLGDVNPIGLLTGEGKKIGVGNSEMNRALKQRIHKGDVLVVCRGSIGRVAIVDRDLPDNSIASQIFAILRVKSHVSTITSAALYQYLISEYGQLQLASLITGASIQMLAAKDLSTLLVPLFTALQIEQLQGARSEVIETYQQIEQLQKNIDRLNSDCIALHTV